MSKGIAQLLKRSTLLMVARIIGGGLAFAMNIMIARWFGADVLGQFALTMALASLLAVLLPAGMQSIAVLFVSRYLADDKLAHARGFLRSGYLHITVLTVTLAALLALSAPLLADYVDQQTLLSGAVALLIAPALALINFNCGALTGFKQQMLGLLPDLLVKPALMFCAVAALALLTASASSLAVISLVCACMWLTAIGQFIAMRRSVRLSEHPPNMSDKKPWRQAATPWIAITLMWDYFIELHLLLAGLVLAPGKIGLLHICFRLRVLAAFGVRALHSLVMPDVYAADAKGDKTGFDRGLAKINFLTLAYCLMVSGTMVIGGEFVLGLVNESFTAGYGMLLAISAAMIPRAVFGPTTAIMAMKGLQVPVVWIVAAGVVLSALLSLGLMPFFGVNAFAYAYLASCTFIALFQWRWAIRKTGIDCSIFASSKVLTDHLAGPRLRRAVGIISNLPLIRAAR